MKYAVKGNANNLDTEAKCHYVSYVLGQQGHIIELDGRRPKPVVKSKCDDPS